MTLSCSPISRHSSSVPERSSSNAHPSFWSLSVEPDARRACAVPTEKNESASMASIPSFFSPEVTEKQIMARSVNDYQQDLASHTGCMRSALYNCPRAIAGCPFNPAEQTGNGRAHWLTRP